MLEISLCPLVLGRLLIDSLIVLQLASSSSHFSALFALYLGC
jgi:hypothetical protein